jgi:hypothetical protein
MTKAIFTKGTCKKSELFETLINIMKNAGWIYHNEDTPTSYPVLYTNGKNGNRHFAINLCWEDGFVTAADIRKTTYADGVFKLGCVTKDPASNSISFRSGDQWDTLAFFPGRRYDTWQNGSNYNRAGYELNWDIDYYYYADKDCVIFVILPFKYTGKENTIMYFGFPEQSFVEEAQRNYTKPFSGGIYANSGHAGTTIGSKRIRVVDNPKNLPELATLTSQPHSVNSLIPQMSPNLDNKFCLSEIFISYGNNIGMRARLGRVYALPPGGMLDGDIIQITINSEVQRYRYTTLGAADQSYTSFPTQAVAIRVE